LALVCKRKGERVVDNNNQNTSGFVNWVVRAGKLTLLMGLVANFVPCLYLWLAYGVVPSIGEIFAVWGLALAAYGISWLVQPTTYFPVLGMSCSYICWYAGSVADVRLPAAMMAQRASEAEPGTPEGDVMATIGTATSVFLSVAILTLFTFIGSKAIPLLPKFIKDSFTVILPAVFAAVYVQFAQKHLKAGAGTIALGLFFYFIGRKSGVPSGLLTVLVVLTGMLVARVVFAWEKKST